MARSEVGAVRGEVVVDACTPNDLRIEALLRTINPNDIALSRVSGVRNGVGVGALAIRSNNAASIRGVLAKAGLVALDDFEFDYGALELI